MPPAPEHQIRIMPAKSGAGPVVGIIIIVALLIFGGLYFWGQELNKRSQAGAAAGAELAL